MFGICLGHQLMGLALGAKTYKLKFGHRGGNHPVKQLEIGRHRDHLAESWLLPSIPIRCRRTSSVTHLNLVRRHRRRAAPHRQADLLGAVPSRGVARAARRRLSVRGIPRRDGKEVDAEAHRHQDAFSSSVPVRSSSARRASSTTPARRRSRRCAAEGLEVVLVNSNPATIMTDPELADRTYVEPLTPEALEKIIERERPDAMLPTVGGQTALNLAVQLDELGILKKYNVELIGAQIPAIKVAEDRLLFRDAMKEIGVAVPESGVAKSLDGSAGDGGADRLPGHHPPVVHHGRRRRRHCLQPRRVQGDRRPRPAPQPGPRDSRRGIGDRLERVRARGDARLRRQLRRHLLDREHRSDGRAHRRQHHRGAGADADRQGIPADARRRAAHHPPGRRRNRRLQHPVRDQSRTMAGWWRSR